MVNIVTIVLYGVILFSFLRLGLPYGVFPCDFPSRIYLFHVCCKWVKNSAHNSPDPIIVTIALLCKIQGTVQRISVRHMIAYVSLYNTQILVSFVKKTNFKTGHVLGSQLC